MLVSLVSLSYNRCSLSMAFYKQKMYSCMFCVSELLIGFTARRMLLRSQYLAEVCQVKVKGKYDLYFGWPLLLRCAMLVVKGGC